MKSSAGETQNLLKQETSPYLLQHADNPVHWMAWNEHSLSLARQSDKPILLSIGYSACHWCHVMAHESFEDNETADIMNDLFINIKVDREERPDLDRIYQNAHSLLTGKAGGWPLTVFLTPDTRMPIFAGTYFPAKAKYGLLGFKTLLQHITEIWRTRKADIEQQVNSLQSSYRQIYEASRPADTDLNRSVIDIARNQIEKEFDRVNGGFSGAPKFPHPATLEFAVKHWSHTRQSNSEDRQILHCALFSLDRMANGGLFDHLGGGFCRYSTDEQWMIPHFEKMLNDNGCLLSLYSQAWKISQNRLFFDAANETANWAIREMQSPEGGYYSSQDADSEGAEGKFFTWSKDEINSVLNTITGSNITPRSIEIFSRRFGLERPANFEDHWHLHGYQSESTLAVEYQLDQEAIHKQLHHIRKHLFNYRENRIHPETDSKILISWNGLMIHGMSVAGRLLNRPEYTQSAIRAANYLKNHCWINDRLHSGTGNKRHNSYLDDYAFLLYGLLELLQNKWDNELYQWALDLAERLLADFEDTTYGGFYFTGHQHEVLIQKLKNFGDEATPSGNAIAALSLNRLGYLSGEQHYIESAGHCLKSAWSLLSQSPTSHCAMLTALNEYLTPPQIIIMRTAACDEKNWQSATQEHYLPFTLVYNIPAGHTLHKSLVEKTGSNTSLAYPCSGMTCHPPIKSIDDLQNHLWNNSYRDLE